MSGRQLFATGHPRGLVAVYPTFFGEIIGVSNRARGAKLYDKMMARTTFFCDPLFSDQLFLSTFFFQENCNHPAPHPTTKNSLSFPGSESEGLMDFFPSRWAAGCIAGLPVLLQAMRRYQKASSGNPGGILSPVAVELTSKRWKVVVDRKTFRSFSEECCWLVGVVYETFSAGKRHGSIISIIGFKKCSELWSHMRIQGS